MHPHQPCWFEQGNFQHYDNPRDNNLGGPDVILTLPDTFHLRRIGGDGNCLFRAMFFIITGYESQHFEIRTSIIAHMLNIPELLTGRGADGHNNYLIFKRSNKS